MSTEKDNPEQLKSKLEVRPGQPLVFSQGPNAIVEPASIPPNQASQIGQTLKAYRDAAKVLLAGKYQDLKPFAPAHLSSNCNITAIKCDDGLIVRFDVPIEGTVQVRVGSIKGTLTEVGAPISEYFVHFPKDAASFDPGEQGPRLVMAKFNLDAPDVQEPVATFLPRILASAELPVGLPLLPPPHKPPCLLSVTNEIEMQFVGDIVPVDSREQGPTHNFVARSKFRLKMGWQALEFYPPLDLAYWKPEYAPLWAENDLLAAVTRQQFADAHFKALDPNVTARKTFQHLFDQFMALLKGPEEPLHQFLKQHPELLCPTHLRMWSKLRLGDRVTDFVFLQPANEYLLVEIESPLRELFRKDGQQREELTHAFNQILDWRVYIEDHLEKVQTELGLGKISPNPSSLIVIGRSSSLTDENRRKITALQSQIPKLRILTYEDVLENAKALAENLFGPIGLTGDNVEFYFKPA